MGLITAKAVALITEIYYNGGDYNMIRRLSGLEQDDLYKVFRSMETDFFIDDDSYLRIKNYVAIQEGLGIIVGSDDKEPYYEYHHVVFEDNDKDELVTVPIFALVESGLWTVESTINYIRDQKALITPKELQKVFPEYYEFDVVKMNDGYNSIVMGSIATLTIDDLKKNGLAHLNIKF